MEEENEEEDPWTKQWLRVSCKYFKTREVPPVSRVMRTGAPKGHGSGLDELPWAYWLQGFSLVQGPPNKRQKTKSWEENL